MQFPVSKPHRIWLNLPLPYNQKNYKHLYVYMATLAESFETFINLSAIKQSTCSRWNNMESFEIQDDEEWEDDDFEDEDWEGEDEEEES